MHDPNSLREQARKCRVLSRAAIEPEVIEQLRMGSRVGRRSRSRRMARRGGTRTHRLRVADSSALHGQDHGDTGLKFRGSRLILPNRHAATFPPLSRSPARNTIRHGPSLGWPPGSTPFSAVL